MSQKHFLPVVDTNFDFRVKQQREILLKIPSQIKQFWQNLYTMYLGICIYTRELRIEKSLGQQTCRNYYGRYNLSKKCLRIYNAQGKLI